jgi:hypothetical protein
MLKLYSTILDTSIGLPSTSAGKNFIRRAASTEFLTKPLLSFDKTVMSPTHRPPEKEPLI